MQRLPPLTELRAFECAARHLSFKSAADELGVTPTAISHQIKLLEQFCGRTLFRRRPRPLALTEAGEKLFPVIRDGFERFAEALQQVRQSTASTRLRITTTNAFAARWLLPRLPSWRRAHPAINLDIVGTDAVLNLKSGDADLAIRYAQKPPQDGPSTLLVRDQFLVVASPLLVDKANRRLTPQELARFPLIAAEWPASDAHAPNWARWSDAARKRYKKVPDFSALATVSFREELHAIEAAIAGQGIAICSDVLVGPELKSGALLQVSPLTLSGYGFYAVHRAGHPKLKAIQAAVSWAKSQV